MYSFINVVSIRLISAAKISVSSIDFKYPTSGDSPYNRLQPSRKYLNLTHNSIRDIHCVRPDGQIQNCYNQLL